LEPADLSAWFNAIRIVRFAVDKPALDALYDYAAYVGCSFGLLKVSLEVDQKPKTPCFTSMAAVQMGNSLDFVALRAKVSAGAANSSLCM
jgi:hypothetical protein